MAAVGGFAPMECDAQEIVVGSRERGSGGARWDGSLVCGVCGVNVVKTRRLYVGVGLAMVRTVLEG